MFNLMFASFVVVLLVILGNYSTAGELGLVTSFWITLTQIFSSNMRSIVISEQKTEYALVTLLYRVIFTILSLSIFIFLANNIIFFDNKILIISIFTLIMLQWINEMNLVTSEVENKLSIFKIFTFINILTIVFSGVFLYFSKIGLFTLLLLFYIIFIFFSLVGAFRKILTKVEKFNFNYIIKLNLKTIAFLSSFSIIISSFAWRIMIYYIFNKSLAGIFFACFSIGSFPGTFFNSVIGPAYIKQKIEIPKIIKNILYLFFIFIFFASVLSLYLLYSQNSINYLSLEFILFTSLLSLIGSYFMSYAMYLRHKKIQSSQEERFYLFKTDIFYGISITFLIPVLFYFGGAMLVAFSYLFASIIALVSYSLSMEKNN